MARPREVEPLTPRSVVSCSAAPHRTIFFSPAPDMCDPFDIASPHLKCLPLLGQVSVPVVDPGHPRLAPRNVIEHLLDDMRRYAEPRHAGGRGAAQIVEPPFRHDRQLIRGALSDDQSIETQLCLA